MDIFDKMGQAVRFAFAFEPYRDNKALVLVRHALNEAGVGLPPDTLPERLEELREQARTILLAAHGLLRVESAALTAAFSRDWDERRAAVDTLAPHFHFPLARIIKNHRLVDKLVTRHYIAHRDRGAGWDLESIANEFGIHKSCLTRAAQVVDHCARHLEAMALNALREALGLPEPRKSQPQAQEVAHA